MTVTALNISSSAIKYFVLKGNEVIKHGSVPPAGPVRNGAILQPESIARQLKSLFASEKLPRNGVICSVNGLPFSSRLFTLPRMAPEAFHEALLRVARKEMPVDPEEMYLTWQVYPAANNEWQILVNGITRQPVDSLLAVLSKARIKPSFLDLQQLALVRLANQQDAIIVEFEKDYSNLVIVAEGVPVAMQIVPSLGADAAIQDEVRQIADRVDKMVEFYNGTHPKKPVPEAIKILLTGEMANDAGAVKLIREEAAYPVEMLDTGAKAFSGLPLHEYAVNAGSTLIDGAADRDGDGNLVPHHHINLGNIARERQAGQKLEKTLARLAVPLAIVAAIGIMIPLFHSRSGLQADVNKLQADMAQANAQYSQVMAAVDSAKTMEENISEIQANTQQVIAGNQAILSPMNYVTDISAIIGALPAGVSYTSISINGETISISGDASTAAPVVQFARNLESSGRYASAEINWINKPHTELEGVGVSFLIVISR